MSRKELRRVEVLARVKSKELKVVDAARRQNLTMRMQLRRFTRLKNAFSKKLDNLKAACALHFAHYNFCRIHQTLRVTPAMAAGIADHIFSIGEIANLLGGSATMVA